MKNILVPTDFSNDAYNALHYTTQLLAGEQCTFHILNVYDEHVALRTPRFLKEGGKVLHKLLADESKEGLMETVHRINRDTENPKHTFKTVSKKGEMLECIGLCVFDWDIDLVVMGNKGKMGAKEIFLGGNTIRTIGRIRKCPVLMVPKETEFIQPKQIAFATYYKRNFSHNVLDPLLYIAQMYRSSIQIMHVDEDKKLDKTQKANKAALEKVLAQIEHSTHWRPHYTEKAKVINDFVKDLGANLLVMVNYEHNLLEKIIREPVIMEIASYLNIPFLVIPCKD
ncbi:universal stress protein [Flagellimonas sp.]|uniref:universal stress protein n=1 Tax=Flagellimonas sp. TaxID=2058762 RepID=UPI003B5085A5